MKSATLILCLATLVVNSATDELIPGISDDLLTDLFGTTPSTDTAMDDCTCVQFFQCKNGTINEYGEGVLDIRSGRKCENTLHQCCRHENLQEDVLTPPTKAPGEELDTGCGIRNPRGVVFEITGAEDGESNFGEFPWMMAIMVKDDTSLVYKCGGSLIHHRVVLTAAHCVDNVNPLVLVVRAGEWDTQSSDETYAYQESLLFKVIKHENFYKGNLKNDVALLILETAMVPEPHIGFVCLPTQGQNVDHSRCFASGWGKENFGQNSHYQNLLKSIELPIMPRDKCQKSFRTTRLGQFFKLHSSFICAGGEKGKDVCKGDGGGPLVCPISDEPTRYLQAGIVAWGIGCGEEGVPGAYASVAQFRTWIDEKMIEEGYGTDTYTRPVQ